MSMLGLDIGTTGVKAVAFREDNATVLASAYREYDLNTPGPGMLELNPATVLDAVKEVTAEVGATTSADPVKSVGTSVLGEAGMPVDANLNPLGNALIGFDPRGSEQCARFREQMDNDAVFDICGHGMNSYHTLCKLAWWKDQEPGVWDKTEKFLCFGDYVTAAMGADPSIDYSMAARSLMFDVNKREWSPEMLGLAGIDESLLAKAVAPGSNIGALDAAKAAEFGLPEGTALAAGLHDQPAGILGAGIKPGESMLAIGTVICLGLRLTHPPEGSAMADQNLCWYPTFGDDQNVSIAFNPTGGSLLKWYRDTLAGPELAAAEAAGVDPYVKINEGLPADPTSLMALPHFTMAGTPYLDMDAAGALLGLRLSTSRKEIVKALLEGIIYEIRLNAELLEASGLPINLYKAIGGAAKSSVWMQIAADILGKPVTIMDVTEGGSLGAALLGAHAAGTIASAAEAEALVTNAVAVNTVYEPDPERAKAYDERFAIYRDVYAANKSISHRLTAL
jgi:xylulokinase